MKRQALLCGLAAMMTISSAGVIADDRIETATPIKHLVVIFQENVSFDHYFGSYPNALNNPGETRFVALAATPRSINNLLTPLDVNNGFAPLEGVDLSTGGSINPGAAGGTLYIAKSAAGVVPTDSTVLDRIRWGTSNAPEGTAATGNSLVLSYQRDAAGTDSDDNAADFTAAAPTPEGSGAGSTTPPTTPPTAPPTTPPSTDPGAKAMKASLMFSENAAISTLAKEPATTMEVANEPRPAPR